MGFYIASPQLRDGENILESIQQIAKDAEGYIQQGQGAVNAGTDAYNTAVDAYDTITGGTPSSNGGATTVPVQNPEQYGGTHEPYYADNGTTETGEAYGPPLPPGYVAPTTATGGNGKTFVVVGLLVATVGYIAKTWGK